MHQSMHQSMYQVLLLWDRLLGYDSLDLLSVLAASVLVFRANLVMQVSFYRLSTHTHIYICI